MSDHPHPQTSSIQERFDGSSGRTWYTFNGLTFITEHGHALLVGSGEWPGFGVDTEEGKNGEPLTIGHHNCIEFDITGQVDGPVHLELSDMSDTVETISFAVDNNQPHQRLLLNKVKGQISKLQFIFSSGEVNCKISAIGFSEAKHMASRMFIPSVAFDIGERSIKMALVDNHQNPLLLVQQDIPATTTSEERSTAIAHSIRALIAHHKLKVQRLSFVVAPRASVFRTIVISSSVKPDELLLAIKRELNTNIPFPADTAAFSALTLPEQNTYFASVSTRTNLLVYQDSAKRAGFPVPAGLDNIHALAHLYTLAYPHFTTVVTVVDIGTSKTDVLVLQQETVLFARRIPLGLHQDGSSAQTLLHELLRTFEYFSNEVPTRSIEKILLCGGGSLQEEFRIAIASRTGLPTELLLNDLEGVPEKLRQAVREHGPRIAVFASVLGLATAKVEERSLLDLFREAHPESGNGSSNYRHTLETIAQNRTAQKWFSVISICITLLLCIALFLGVRTAQLKHALQVKRQQYKAIEVQAASANALMEATRQADVLMQQLSANRAYVRLLDRITSSRSSLTLVTIEYVPAPPRFIIEGLAPHEAEIQRHVKALRNEAGVRMVEVGPYQTIGAQIQCKLTVFLSGGK